MVLLTQIVRILPPQTSLQIMILNDQSHKPSQQMIAFLVRKVIDFSNMVPHSKHTLPPSYWISTDNRMNGLQHFPYIFRRAPRTSVDLKVVLLGNLVELGLGICCRQAIQKLLVWL